MDLPRITGYVLVGLLGIALWPMSAIAVVMTESLDNLYPELGQALCSAVLCAVLYMELLGSLAARAALWIAGEERVGA